MKSGSRLSKHDQLVTIAFLKFKLGYTHAKIAQLFNISEMTVTRMLKTAIAEGIVTISVKMPIDENEALSKQIKQKYSLRDVLIIKNNQYEDAITTVSKAAASYLDMVILPLDVLGLAAGRVLSHVLPYMNLPSISPNTNQFEVVQVQGGYSNLDQQNPTSTIVNFVNRFGIPGHLLLYPMYSTSESGAQLLYSQNKTYLDNLWRRCSILLTGVGVFEQNEFKREESLLTESDITELKKKGAVGVVFGRWFNADGKYLDCAANRKVMSITPELQSRILKRVLVAFGDEKVTVIDALLKAKVSNIFISDENTAKKIANM